MKIALCLQGLSTGKNDKGNPVSFTKSLKSIQNNIINLNNVDVFIHTWNTDPNSKKIILEEYKPIKSLFQSQIFFNLPIHLKHLFPENAEGNLNPMKYHSIKSRWYSQMKSIELKEQYEKENNFTYDFVMISRFDCFYKTFINFKQLDPNRFYVSHWEHNRGGGFLDYWFISGSSNMNKFSSLYCYIDNYLNSGVEPSNHILSKHHVFKTLNLKNNISYILTPRKDFELNRFHFINHLK